MTMETSEDCCVKVAVHVRPLIGDERLQGCIDCVNVVPGKPQIQIGTHSFTFDHVYGSSGSPSSSMFEECVAPLVDGLFQGYNATVLAYGQTGSGKTYTMGTGSNDSQSGLIPQVMNALFRKMETLKHESEFQLNVSFIEILKEEVHDLLDSTSLNKSETTNGHAVKIASPGKPPIQIRESSNGVITLAGSTEVGVSALKEMAACLEQGSLSRATGSTNMNNQSSRSHAIFTITLEQIRKPKPASPGDTNQYEDMSEEYLCAKLHLVDLAGSERAKRTGSDGLRFKEGVHINKGLLALGNVISALGDEKKRKEGAHVPYRDSKLTRLLQDSLGGNSRTVMIACISPADINVEETLNTLKYANRARNIQNKPIVNRDPRSNEMQKMRQQLECLQAELLTRSARVSSEEVQVLKERIAWLEASNADLCRELHEYRRRSNSVEHCATNSPQGADSVPKSDGLKRGLQNLGSSDLIMAETITCDNSKEIDEEVAKEWEHTLLQNTMDKELNELNKRLEQKESEMKLFGGFDTMALKQHFGKKIMELEDEKRTVQQDRDRLLAEVESLAANSDGQTQKMQDVHTHKLKALEAQILDLKKKQDGQVQIVKQKQRTDEATKRLQDEIQYIKSQKVQLQHRIKQEAEQFRQWKASREKELLQLRKEGRKNEYERHKLQALNQRQKMVLQRKTEEAAMATKRLKELLEGRKSSSRDSSGTTNGNHQNNEKSLQKMLDHELEVLVNVHEVRLEYEKQSQVRAALAEELAILKQEDGFASKGFNSPSKKNGHSRVSSMTPNTRMSRIASLESMMSISSNALVAMASQLSEAGERERAFTGRGHWNQLRTMVDAKNLLQQMFNAAADARCRLWEKEVEVKEMKEQLKELVGLLRQSEARRKEIEKQQKLREQSVAVALATSTKGNGNVSPKYFADDMCGSMNPMAVLAQKQLKFTPGIANGSIRESAAFLDQTRKMVPIGQLSMGKKLAVAGQAGKLWKWKRSHHQWLVQYKWKWQKPWRLSEYIRHSDETIVRTKPRQQIRAA
ncbi:hypothetical protein C5167_016901 [Papaver somniferum]|uniref:Kinesin motor domain-containing protein n=1 Tax=Papaver somniferum TaxID=3469 RepID=A0A4Y7IHV1_PAPSO|nr:kinesin-like protein KIN-4A isoform X1 [Papaver somniferum]RZC48473.1 hypothetical protein C5167_016901 [Papaver somniferum]